MRGGDEDDIRKAAWAFARAGCTAAWLRQQADSESF